MRLQHIIAAALAAAAVALAAGCGGGSSDGLTLAGRGLTMQVADVQVVEDVAYQDTDSRYYRVGPAMAGHRLVVARVTIWNDRSGRLSLLVDEKAALLEGANREEAPAINPYERRVALDAAPEQVSPHLPFLWGPSDLPQDFSIMGWVVFEVPDEVDVKSFEWEQVDRLRFPVSLG